MEMSSAQGLSTPLCLHINQQNCSLSYSLGPALAPNNESEQKTSTLYCKTKVMLQKKVAQLDSSHSITLKLISKNLWNDRSY